MLQLQEYLQMNPITEKELTAEEKLAELTLWFEVKAQLDRVKAQELELRNRIAKSHFPAPVEGTNTANLTDGWVLKMKYPLNRKLDEPQFLAMREALIEQGVRTDELVVYKPDLSVSAYRTLTAEQMHFFDQCLTITPGTPSLEIVKPKRV
jgi:hypothetical protein